MVIAPVAIPTHSMRSQTEVAKQSEQSGVAPSSTKWIEDKVLVRVDAPSVSDSGNLVLTYTLTNKTGQDIDLDFSENPEPSSRSREPIRIFLKLKEPSSYSRVTPKDHFLYLPDKLVPPDFPLSFHIVIAVSRDDKPSWYSSESGEDRLRRLLKKKLGNVESITVFVPDRRLRITLPIASQSKK